MVVYSLFKKTGMLSRKSNIVINFIKLYNNKNVYSLWHLWLPKGTIGALQLLM